MKTLRWLQRANSEEIKKVLPLVIEVNGEPEFVVRRYDGADKCRESEEAQAEE